MTTQDPISGPSMTEEEIWEERAKQARLTNLAKGRAALRLKNQSKDLALLDLREDILGIVKEHASPVTNVMESAPIPTIQSPIIPQSYLSVAGDVIYGITRAAIIALGVSTISYVVKSILNNVLNPALPVERRAEDERGNDKDLFHGQSIFK